MSLGNDNPFNTAVAGAGIIPLPSSNAIVVHLLLHASPRMHAWGRTHFTLAATGHVITVHDAFYGRHEGTGA